MALHGNDPSQFTRADNCAPENAMLKSTNALFHNVDLSSHISSYPVNSYGHNAQLILKNLSHHTGRPEFCLPQSYSSLGHDNHTDDSHMGGSEQSLDFGHRSGTHPPGHHSYFPDNPGHDLYSERNQSSTGHVVRTRRRKAGGMEEARVCVVCGEPASGYNFDRLTCESCKAFFRRNALKPKEKIKACGRNGDCNIEGSQRKHCPSCRLEKCLAVGMKKELILPPEKLEQRAKPKRRKQHATGEDGPGGLSGSGLLLPTSFPGSNAFSSAASLHHHPRTPGPHGAPFGPDDAVTSRTLNTLFTDITGPRGGQNPLLSSLAAADPQAAAAAVKFHLANMTNNGGAPFDRLPPPPQFPGDGPTAPFLSDAAPFLSDSGRLPPRSGGWQQGIPPIPLAETPKPLDSPYSNSETGLLRPRRCRYREYPSFCYHSACRRAFLKQQRRHPSEHHRLPPALVELERPDEQLLTRLTECVQRIREPFSPDEPLETKAAETLEQEYNRMDTCIRRIIRVVKMLPYFIEIGKPAQLGLLRANIYGMIVLYSSFFFERDIRKLRYPIKHSDGTLSTVTVSMLDDLAASTDKSELAPSFLGKDRAIETAGLREDFELYKANTLAAFNHLDELAGGDDTLRMALLAVKLFSDDSLADDLRSLVVPSKRAYLVFLWTYIRWRLGPRRLRQATELFARLHLAFIDLRSLEIRMTEFAKLVSLEGLSPLMREICSLRSNSGNNNAKGGNAAL